MTNKKRGKKKKTSIRVCVEGFFQKQKAGKMETV